MNSILTLNKNEMETLKQRYGNAFYRVYKKELEKTLEHQELLDKLLAPKDEPQDTRPYGSLLDKYIR